MYAAVTAPVSRSRAPITSASPATYCISSFASAASLASVTDLSAISVATLTWLPVFVPALTVEIALAIVACAVPSSHSSIRRAFTSHLIRLTFIVTFAATCG